MIERCTSDLPVPVEPTMAIMGCLGGILLKCLNLCQARNMRYPWIVVAGEKSRNYLEDAMTCDREGRIRVHLHNSRLVQAGLVDDIPHSHRSHGTLLSRAHCILPTL
jgi:hypothetical protein